MPSTFSYERERAYYSRPGRLAEPQVDLGPYLHSVVEHPIDVFGGKRVLEIGAGPARYSRMFVERFQPRHVVALDLVAGQICRKGNMSAVGGDCLALPFCDESVDVVFGSLVLHRFRDLAAVVREARRVLRSHGLYIGIEPSLMNPLHLMRHLLSDHSPNEFLLARGELSESFASAGFAVSVAPVFPRASALARVGLGTCVGIRAEKA